MARPLVIAHRGASAEAPENTLAAFRRALDVGADGVELDVRLTRDGVPVVFHDPTLARLAGRRTRLSSLTLAELRSFRIRGEPVPALEEVLTLTRGRAVAQVEIKEGVPVAPVVRAVVRARATGRVIFASFAAATVAAARAAAPQIPRMLIRHRGRAGALAALLDKLGAAGVSLDHRHLPSAALIAALHGHGRQVWCWTVNDPEAMGRLAGWGVDALISDNPALLKATVEGMV